MRFNSYSALTLAVVLLLSACASPEGTSSIGITPDAGGSADGGGTPLPDGGAVPPATLVQCASVALVPSTGTCAATKGSGTAVVLHGNVLGDGTTYANGEVVYDGDKIVCAACDCTAAPGYAQATRLECGGAAVSPGLINAHDHLNYNDRWPLASTAAGGARFEHRHGWRGTAKTPSNTYGTAATSNGMRWSELRQLMSGTTSMVASTKANGLVRNLDELEARDTNAGLAPLDYEVFLLGDSNEQFKSDCKWNYGKTEYAVSLLPGMVTHTAEGINEYAHEEFRCQSRSTLGGQDYTEKNVAHIHAVGLRGNDYFQMAQEQTKLIWSPRSNVSLYGTTAEAPTLDRLGGVVALGTDWTYSGSATLPREMACAADLSRAKYNNYFSAEAIWRMGTKNAALATNSANRLGTLTAGKLADIAIFRADAGKFHEAVIQSTTRDVALVIRGGEVMFGESALVRSLNAAGAACDAVDVCGNAKEVCASRDLKDATYAQIAAAVKDGTQDATRAYPAVFCGAPEQEPSCAPSRPGQFAGNTADDSDGDGVANSNDNCPTMFNPIRPMDNGKQTDSDADGTGDICDATPIAADIDGDGVPNTADNCVYDANTNQADGDGDGKGDSCDGCPQLPNSSSLCGPSPTNIVDIRTGVTPTGALVQLQGVVVTAVDTKGAMVQDLAISNGKFAGLYVYLNRMPTVAIGDVVNVTGTATEFNGQTQVANASIAKGSSGSALQPIDVSIADANSEAFEGVLVRVRGLTDASAYDCKADVASCPDTQLWQANSSLVVSNQFYAGAPFPSAASELTGVMFFRYSKWRMCPRNSSDVIAPTL